MLQKVIWYIKFFRYCWDISKQKEDLQFFLTLPEDDGKRYQLNLRELKRKIPKATKRGTLTKPLLLRNELYHTLQDQPDESFKEEITVIIMMMILWGMQRAEAKPQEE